MPTTTGRNWNQIIMWAIAIVVVLALLGWWGGVFDQQASVTEEPATQTTTPSTTEPPADTTEPTQPQ